MPEIEFRSISKTYPDGTPAVRDLSLHIADGEFLCILGPSGCGKSSTLRMLAGLEQITTGDLFVDRVRINEMPPRRRDMAMVFENYALYPHLDVYHNIAMPLSARGVDGKEIRQRVTQVCETLRLTEHLQKRPQTLSGGQRQRVALGRALIRRPRIFLMDEPLGHLEAYLRVELRAEIRRLHEERRTTTVYITHDQQEAAALADRIAVMNGGRLQQLGAFLHLFDRPANRFVAQFVGERPINLLPADVIDEAGSVSVKAGDLRLPLTPAQANRLMHRRAAQGPVELGVRPEDLHIVEAGTEESLSGRAIVVEPQGDQTVVVVDTAIGRIDALVPSEEAPDAEGPIGLQPTASRIQLFAANGETLFADPDQPREP